MNIIVKAFIGALIDYFCLVITSMCIYHIYLGRSTKNLSLLILPFAAVFITGYIFELKKNKEPIFKPLLKGLKSGLRIAFGYLRKPTK
jgi:hypothetical protein